MTTEQEDTLTIDAVVRSFQAANAQLQLAAEKIDVIAQHEATTARASSSLEASAASVGRLVNQTDEAVKSLQAALDMASQSLRAGAALLDSAVLTELQREVGTLGSLIQDVEGRIGAAEGTILPQLESLGAGLSGLRADVEALNAGSQAHASELSELSTSAARITRSNGRLMMLGGGILVLQVVSLVLLLTR